jgi:hypothetical protein
MEIGRCYGIEINEDKTKVRRVSRQPSSVTIMIDQNYWRMWKVLYIWVAY